MALDVLDVLGLARVDVARQVEVEVVLLAGDFVEGHHAGAAGHVGLLAEGVDDAVDVLGAEPVLVAVFDVAAGGVEHEDAAAGDGVLLVQRQDADGDAGAVEQVGGQADDALEAAGLHQPAADDGLRMPTEQHTVGQDARTLAGAVQGADQVQQIGIVPLLGRRLAPGEALIGVVGGREASAPGLSEKGGLATA
jgi:hypothetical protein